ncbi:MAG: HD domain-containing protein [Alphaproteobacteria bacterium]|nr:HD domain-containing protein [Alphaproteobacteria bacterium]
MAETNRSITDPVHGFIKFNKNDPLEHLALDLIDTKAFQRLRNIQQLGVVSLIFPSATHTRFTHSIGTFFVAREMCDLVQKLGYEDKSKRDTTLIAALLHDIGHGPHSHIFERIMHKATGKNKKHELWSAEIITQHPEISNLLNNYRPNFANEVANYITMNKDERDLYPSIISGAFDADRMDYMIRDRQMCGISGSAVDKTRIMNSLDIYRDDKDNKLYFGIKANAQSQIEEYLTSRMNLYSEIYRQKREFAYTLAVDNFFQIALKKNPQHLFDNPHNPLEKMLNGEMSLDNYLKTRDSNFDELFVRMAESNDPEIALAAEKILNRNAYEVKETMTTTKDADAKIKQTKQVLSKIEGVAFEETTIKAYNPNGKEMPIKIIDNRDGGKVYELSEVSINNVQNLSKRIFRAYIPQEQFEKAQTLLKISENKQKYYAQLKYAPEMKTRPALLFVQNPKGRA